MFSILDRIQIYTGESFLLKKKLIENDRPTVLAEIKILANHYDKLAADLSLGSRSVVIEPISEVDFAASTNFVLYHF